MHIFQVGVGSGGMVVLDLIARNAAIDRITIVDPDSYAAKNVYRHCFPSQAVGQPKVELAAEWVRERRSDLEVLALEANLCDPALQSRFAAIAASCDLGVCAVDNEPAKYAFDSLMRAARKPWTLGEVLSGGIGGWIHRFSPDGPCYGCVASHLQRAVVDEPTSPPPDYANPGDAVAETTIPASKASIEAIASLHALAMLECLGKLQSNAKQPGEPFTSMLFSLRTVPGIFEEAYKAYRFRIERDTSCLICSMKTVATGSLSDETLDVELDQALGRLAPQ
jgi:molybdopterin/thiamine biosynthesis adenylyltransferase